MCKAVSSGFEMHQQAKLESLPLGLLVQCEPRMCCHYPISQGNGGGGPSRNLPKVTWLVSPYEGSGGNGRGHGSGTWRENAD